jgi:hypothetical protein
MIRSGVLVSVEAHQLDTGAPSVQLLNDNGLARNSAQLYVSTTQE